MGKDKGKKGKKHEMDDLKKELDLVSPAIFTALTKALNIPSFGYPGGAQNSNRRIDQQTPN